MNLPGDEEYERKIDRFLFAITMLGALVAGLAIL